jgi:3-hydroxyisobutyrate dehydrogenase-like beta-hydroxyacid dehydrogenase
MNTPDIVFVGLGEAGQAFAGQLACAARGYDRKQDAAKRAEFDANHVVWSSSNAEAVADAPLIVSLVTADQALLAAEETAHSIAPGALFCDLNSVAPDTKRTAARAIEAAGGLYVDVAVMAPVNPQRLNVSMLVSGPHAEAGSAALSALGFNTRIVGEAIGDASAIKMIRSVMVKGIEALSAECALAAHAAGVEAEVLASLDKSWKEQSWAERFDYNLDRMLVHGLRRAAEMEEVVKTLDALGTGSQMTRGTVVRQRAIGAIGQGAPEGLRAKVDLVAPHVMPAQTGISGGEGATQTHETPAFAGVTEQV